MTAYLGGLDITGTKWAALHGLAVTFTSTWTGFFHQVYAGRRLVGITVSTDDRTVVGSVTPSGFPQQITLVAVSAADRETDFGDQLPLRPFNRVSVVLPEGATSGWADVDFIDLVGGTEPGGAVDADNLLAREPYDVDREYVLTTPPLESGTWSLEVAGRDDAGGGGNLGAAMEVSATLTAHPEDLALRSDGNRFTVTARDAKALFEFEVV